MCAKFSPLLPSFPPPFHPLTPSFSSFAITAKFWEDDRLFNSHIAPACGMRLDHLNKMEILFLTSLKFEVTVTEQQVKKGRGERGRKSVVEREKERKVECGGGKVPFRFIDRSHVYFDSTFDHTN